VQGRGERPGAHEPHEPQRHHSAAEVGRHALLGDPWRRGNGQESWRAERLLLDALDTLADPVSDSASVAARAQVDAIHEEALTRVAELKEAPGRADRKSGGWGRQEVRTGDVRL